MTSWRRQHNRLLRAASLGAALLAAAAPASAHPGPHEEIARLDALIAAEPARADLHLERAVQFRLAGQYDAALADLASAEKLAPEDPAVHLHRGLILAEMGRDADAEAAFTTYLGGGAGSALALAERGRARERLGKSEDALADYAAAVALDGQLELFLLRGAAQERLGRWAEAAEGYRAGLAKFAAEPALLEGLVRVDTARKDYAAALGWIETALIHTPHRPQWLLRKGDVLTLAARLDEARAAREAALAEIDAAIAARPSAIHLVTRAEICLALGREEEAEKSLGQALQKAPHYRAAQELQAKLMERRQKAARGGGAAPTPPAR